MSVRSMEAKMSSFRRRRSLLNRAYRAARRAGNKAYRSNRTGHTASDHFLQAEKIRGMAEADGLVVGGIQDSDRTRSIALLQLARERNLVNAVQQAQTQNTVQVPQQVPTDNSWSVEAEDEQLYPNQLTY